MADIEFECPKCRQPLAADERGAGQRIKCPHCGGKFTIPTKAGERYDKFGNILPSPDTLLAVMPSTPPVSAPIQTCAKCKTSLEPEATACRVCGTTRVRFRTRVQDFFQVNPRRQRFLRIIQVVSRPTTLKAMAAIVIIASTAYAFYATRSKKADATSTAITPTVVQAPASDKTTDDFVKSKFDHTATFDEKKQYLQEFLVQHADDKRSNVLHSLSQ